MKKNYTLAVLLFTMSLSFGQSYFYESFDYALGNLGIASGQVIPAPNLAGTTNTNWNFGSTRSAVVQTGSLTYTGLLTSSTSTKNINLINTGNSANIKVNIASNTIGSGVITPVYYSFLMKVNSAPVAVTRIISVFGTNNGGGNGSTFAASVYAISATGGYQIIVAGADVSSAPDVTSTQTSSVLATGTTVLIVVKYTPNAAASGGISKFWINPAAASFGATEPTPTFDLVNNGTIYEVAGCTLKTGLNMVNADLDELRIGSTWAEVTPSSSSLGIEQNSISGLTIYPNPVKNGEFSISKQSNGVKSVQIFDVLGKQVYSKNILADEKIKTSNLGAGMYILSVEENGKTATRKLIIE